MSLAAIPGSETRVSNAALSINLKLIVNGEKTQSENSPAVSFLMSFSPFTTRPAGSARDKTL